MQNYPKTFEELLQYYLLHVLTLARAGRNTRNVVDRHNLARQTLDMLEGLTEVAEKQAESRLLSPCLKALAALAAFWHSDCHEREGAAKKAYSCRATPVINGIKALLKALR